MSGQTQGPDLSGLLSGLMANPGAMAALTSLLGNLQASGGGPPPPPPCREEEAECCPPPGRPGRDDGRDCRRTPPLLPPTPPPPPPKPKEQDRRACLLAALRPYLSPERCETVDALLRILELMELFRHRR